MKIKKPESKTETEIVGFEISKPKPRNRFLNNRNRNRKTVKSKTGTSLVISDQSTLNNANALKLFVQMFHRTSLI